MGFRTVLPGESGLRYVCHLGRASFDLLSKQGVKSFAIAIELFFRRRIQYGIWIEKNEPDEAGLKRMSAKCKNISYKPKISIIMPTWNTVEAWLREAIESLRIQTYDNWELCIADGGSTVPWVKGVLEEYAQRDARIKVKFLMKNLGIAGNSNQALSLAKGELVGFLDHDDTLAPFALQEVVELLNHKPSLHFIYSDEDKINKSGQRSNPFFKPDWSPDMFLSCNYPIHVSILRKSLVDDLSGFREGYDGSQDYDLLLRVSEVTSEDKIAHIPKVLYHWRAISTSMAASSKSKPYAFGAAKRALEDAMHRRGTKIEEVSNGLWAGSYRIRYKIEGDPRVSIIIPTKDEIDILRQCIDSILKKTAYQNSEIILVDDQSHERYTLSYYDELKDNEKVRILHYDDVFNYSAINNFAVTNCASEYLLFLNNDTEVISEEWLSSMLEHAQRPNVGAVGAKLLFPNGLIQHCGVILGYGSPKIAGHHYYRYPDHHDYPGVINTIRNFSAVTGACMMTRRSVFEEVGGLDERHLGVSLNDIDYCLKLRNEGYLIVYTPYASLYHHESLSRGFEDTTEKITRFSKEVDYFRGRWGKIIDSGDPYYNPNLTLDRVDFSIKV